MHIEISPFDIIENDFISSLNIKRRFTSKPVLMEYCRDIAVEIILDHLVIDDDDIGDAIIDIMVDGIADKLLKRIKVVK